MSISHRTNRLKLVGSPSVEQLQNGRYKLTVTCSTMNSREDWYSANKARIFPDFGSLQSAEMSIDGLAPRTGEAYADMRLTQVESGNRSTRDGGDYIVVLTYETLGSAFVQVKDDDTDYELNGLRRVRRTSIAEAGTDYAKTVGTSFIDHQIDDETAVRCFLASYDIDDTDSFRQVQEVWLEAGTLNVQRRSESEGVYRVTTTFLGVEGSVVGPIVARVEDDYEGLKTITVVSMQDASGASLVAVASQPVASHSTLSEFSYPGVVTISSETLAGTGNTFTFLAKDFSLQPPVVSRVPATIKVSFKTTSAISYTANGGLWNPTTWAEGSSKGIAWNYLPFSISRGFRGYRINPNATNSYSGYGSATNSKDMISGKRIFANTTYSIQVSGGPPNPVGNQYTLDYSVSLAFEDVNGVPYYKHKEIVSTIPLQ